MSPETRLHIPDVIWVEIKNIALAPYWRRKYSEVLTSLPRLEGVSGPRVVYTSAAKPYRFIKFIYRLQRLAGQRCVVTYMRLPIDLPEDPTWHQQIPESSLQHFAHTEYRVGLT